MAEGDTGLSGAAVAYWQFFFRDKGKTTNDKYFVVILEVDGLSFLAVLFVVVCECLFHFHSCKPVFGVAVLPKASL